MFPLILAEGTRGDIPSSMIFVTPIKTSPIRPYLTDSNVGFSEGHQSTYAPDLKPQTLNPVAL